MEAMEEDGIFGGKTPPPPNLQLFPIASTPFHFFPFFRQPSNPNNLHLLVGASNGFRQIQRSFVSNVDKLLIMVDNISRHTQILDKLLSFPAHLHACFQIPRSDSKSFSTLSSRNFAAILPGDAVGGLVVANGISSFLNIYNTLLIVRLVLTWFPNAPPAVVSPLSTLCDPYLNIFRGLIPPLGGLDLSPILAFLVLNAFTSTAAALPAELPHTGKASDKWTMRLAGSRAKRSKGEQM